MLTGRQVPFRPENDFADPSLIVRERRLAQAAIVWLAALTAVGISVGGSQRTFADTPTPITSVGPVVDVSPEATPTAVQTITPTSTPVPSPTPVPRITVAPERRARHVRRKRVVRARPTVSVSAVPTVTPAHESVRSKPRHTKHKKRRASPTLTSTPSPTPSPTPTSTPALNLTAEDSVAPVTCNGPSRPNRRPFLMPPYHGNTSIVSYFDHELPNFVQDALTVIANGFQAAPDRAHVRTDFPAYWDPAVRQFLDYDGHNGYDYDLSYRPVYAAAAGTVIFAALEYPDAPQHGYGNMVMIDHHNGYVTLYGHLSKMLVVVGHKVHRGQKIAISGNTGHSTGPHLHFSVFHNCTPTDPYGWSGSGQDPLVGFKGESSSFLWRKSPNITNPLPRWPGLNRLSTSASPQELLLDLPSGVAGASQFERSVRKRAERVLKALRTDGVSGRIDMVKGGVTISQSVAAETVYRLPYVVSIEAPDSVDGARSDFLAAFAKATLAGTRTREPLDHSKSWTGYLVSLAGRTVLVGIGAKGHEVALRLAGSGAKARTLRLRADSTSGVYGVDLGKLSKRQDLAIQHDLAGSPVVPIHAHKTGRRPARGSMKSAPEPGSGRMALLGLALLVALSLVAVLSKRMWRGPKEVDA